MTTKRTIYIDNLFGTWGPLESYIMLIGFSSVFSSLILPKKNVCALPLCLFYWLMQTYRCSVAYASYRKESFVSSMLVAIQQLFLQIFTIVYQVFSPLNRHILAIINKIHRRKNPTTTTTTTSPYIHTYKTMYWRVSAYELLYYVIILFLMILIAFPFCFFSIHLTEIFFSSDIVTIN